MITFIINDLCQSREAAKGRTQEGGSRDPGNGPGLAALYKPQHIVSTTLRADSLQGSGITKNIIMMELTVPWENRLGEAHERKRTKYEQLNKLSRAVHAC